MRLRPAVVVLAGGLVLAAGSPAIWAGSRPPTAAGPPLTSVVASNPVPPGPVPRPAAGASDPVVHPADPLPDAPMAAPVRLVVPDVGIDAPVDPVGVTPDGLLQLPDDVHRVGWYRSGPVPGQPQGSAVLAGHVDSWNQGLGALSRLPSVEPGQQIAVTDAAGQLTRWQVVTRQLVVKQQLPLPELFTRSGPPRLVLLTCGGPFDERLRSYRDNLVVVAVPAP
jgi:Sortase domain